jgi:hypothetical protein
MHFGMPGAPSTPLPPSLAQAHASMGWTQQPQNQLNQQYMQPQSPPPVQQRQASNVNVTIGGQPL